MMLGEARPPAGMRLYAIGDVHGRDDLLAAVHDAVDADLRLRPAGAHRLIHVGDYVDRGPDSAGVIRRLARLSATDPDVVCLCGNHDERMLAFIDDPVAEGRLFFANGGGATLASYGINGAAPAGDEDVTDRGNALREAMPDSDLAFLRNLKLMARFGDYLFVHAGIRPGVPLDAQDPHDLMWIRADFLNDPRDHGVVVVHGHTPVPRPDIRANRIDIDTGAFNTGNLTCLVQEGTDWRLL